MCIVINKVARSIREFIRRGFEELLYKERYALNWHDDSLIYVSESEAENLNRMLNGESPILRKKPRHMYPRCDRYVKIKVLLFGILYTILLLMVPWMFFFRLLKNMPSILFAVHSSEISNPLVQSVTKFLHPIIIPNGDTELKYIVPVTESRLINGLWNKRAKIMFRWCNLE